MPKKSYTNDTAGVTANEIDAVCRNTLSESGLAKSSHMERGMVWVSFMNIQN